MNREELAAVRGLLTAIHDALEDLPVHDKGNAIARWAAAYCNAGNAAAWVDLAAERKLLAGDSLTERLAGYADQIRKSLPACGR